MRMREAKRYCMKKILFLIFVAASVFTGCKSNDNANQPSPPGPTSSSTVAPPVGAGTRDIHGP